MPASAKKSCLAVLRNIAGITQRELAEMVDCAPITVQSIELGKLRLSERLARRIALQTGADLDWLMAGDYKTPPTCPREAGEPYSKRHYQMTRAEIADPRTDPFDLAHAENVLADAARQLAGGLLTAYRKNQSIFFYYKLREALEDFRVEFPPAKDLPTEQKLGELTRQLHRLLVKAADAKRSRLRREKP
jgi:transcriptional regulator with XRE-family HTH domain